MTDEIELPKTPEEAEKLLREWYEKGDAIEKLLRESPRREVYEKAVQLVGGHDRAYEIKHRHKRSPSGGS